ncbi:MAG: hypothetical protein HOC70_02305 [Gammaproteobacteria bacterium]|nr:hypothetical protein [Gammaproteobacteria bacterium]MBT4492045.1 hypothetical protein [Gammaproteobacteria bacterium]MBT7372023.1 hypothetical protein [Gammaproteobacteria bacterium]
MNRTIVGVAVVVVIAAIAGVGIYISQSLDGVVKNAIETVGTESTGTKVVVKDVKLSLSEGAGVVSGLTVANPTGFSAEKLFVMDSILVDIDPASLVEEVYIIDTIAIDGARVLAEQVGGGTNIQALMNGMSSEASGSGEGEGDEEGQEVQLAVREISFTNGNLDLRSDVLGERTLTLPDFTLKDLGSAEQGLTPDELGAEIATELLGQVKDAVMDEISDLAREAAMVKLKEKVGEKAAAGLDKLKGLFKKED